MLHARTDRDVCVSLFVPSRPRTDAWLKITAHCVLPKKKNLYIVTIHRMRSMALWPKQPLLHIVCLSDGDGLKHIDGLLTFGFGDSDVKSLLLLNRVFRVGVDQTGQYLDIVPRSTHRQWIWIQHEHWSSEHTMKETARQTCVRQKMESDSERDEATRYRAACIRLSYLVKADSTSQKPRSIWPRD